MGQLMLPPEMLPCTESSDAEVVVCVGPPRCAGGGGPCPWCVTLKDATTDLAVTDH